MSTETMSPPTCGLDEDGPAALNQLVSGRATRPTSTLLGDFHFLFPKHDVRLRTGTHVQCTVHPFRVTVLRVAGLKNPLPALMHLKAKTG